jgi:cell wall-associated NlpC family hydrolase
MIKIEGVQSQFIDASIEYETTQCLNLYDSEELQSLATQARIGLHLRIQPAGVEASAFYVTLCEDSYSGWISADALKILKKSTSPYTPVQYSQREILLKIPTVIAFAQAAMACPNTYLWGGTVGPDYDCSGLVQHAFSSQGIWLPRDAYQQEAFVQPLTSSSDRTEDLIGDLELGDLIFFGTPIKATHVALYLGDGAYIHSSGIAQGRNGIGIDQLTAQGDLVSRNYYRQVRGAGRVVQSYQPCARN